MIRFTLTLSISLLLLFMTSCEKKPSEFWTSNGTTVETIRWQTPQTDDAVLTKENGRWVLPNVPMDVQIETTVSRRLAPPKSLPPFFKTPIRSSLIRAERSRRNITDSAKKVLSFGRSNR